MEIVVQNLTKQYKGGKLAVDNINLTIHDGMFGLLGPNGAGKTTLMRILVTMMKPSAGQVKIDGLDLQKYRKEIRRMLGYLPQDFNTFPKVKSWEFLDYSAKLAGISNRSTRISKIDELLERIGLYEVRERLANKLSGGMKRRLGIAQALLGDPKILIVDEPTTGLDPEERIRFRNILTEMSQEERIIVLSTHIVGDISSTCNEMALLVDGKVGFSGAPHELIEQARGYVFQIDAQDSDLAEINEKFSVISTIPSENGWQVQVVTDNAGKYKARKIEPNLEHAYVNFVEQFQGERFYEDQQEIIITAE